jgi:GTP cyclohydrolase I
MSIDGRVCVYMTPEEKKEWENGKRNQNNQLAIQKLKGAYEQIIEAVGEDARREGLVQTPQRAAIAMLTFTQGYQLDINSKYIMPLSTCDDSL